MSFTGKIILFAALGLVGISLVSVGAWQLLSPLVSSASYTPQPSPTMILQVTPPEASVTPYPSLTASPTGETSVPQALATVTSTPTAWQACANTFLSHLRPGMKAKLAEEPPLPNRIREQASTTAKIVGMIQPGEVVDVVDGPGCANNWVWWKIRNADGLTGWTAEGDGQEYWLLPYP